MEKARKWIEKYRSALVNKNFDHYASLFTDDVEYYDEPFEPSIGDESAPNSEHFKLRDSMKNFIGNASVGVSESEIICTSDSTAVYRFDLFLESEIKKNEKTAVEFVVITKFENDLCKYYYQIFHEKSW